MKVLLIDVNCKSGSTGKIAYDIYQELRNDGIEATICYGRGKLIEEDNIYKFAGKLEVCFHALMTRVTGLTGCFSPIATRRLIKYIDNYKPDVVHIHELHGYFVNIKPVINYLKKKNIKVVWTYHCEFMYTGRCGYSYSCHKWKAGCGKCPNIREYPTSSWFDFSHKMFLEKKKLHENFNNLTIVSPSNWLADEVRKSFLKDKKVQVVHNGIETSKIFYPHDYKNLKIKHQLRDEKIVLAVAPDLMQERKGGKWIIELAQMMKGENVKFIMIGVERPEEINMPNIIALGRTENQIELAQYYSMADVFAICSVMENFPTVCIEALCCGTPVCGFDVGGTKETVPEGFGKFVEYGNVPELKKAIIYILSQNIDSSKCSQYGKEHYDKKVMYNSYRIIYGI